jgi:hypothetical protein
MLYLDTEINQPKRGNAPFFKEICLLDDCKELLRMENGEQLTTVQQREIMALLGRHLSHDPVVLCDPRMSKT